MKLLSKSRGFSLVELLVVLALMALATAVVLPNIAGTLRHMKLKTTTKELAASFRYARCRAISQKTTATVSIDLGSNIMTFTGGQPSIPSFAQPQIRDDSKERGNDGYHLARDDRFYRENGGDGQKSSGGSSNAFKRKRLSDGVYITFEPFSIDEVYIEGSVDIEFHAKGNCTGGIFKLYDESERMYMIYLDPITGRCIVPDYFQDAGS